MIETGYAQGGLDTLESPSFPAWKKVLEDNPGPVELEWLTDWIGAWPSVSGVKRARLWEELMEAPLEWSTPLLEKVALRADGPPDSGGWVWLLSHPASSMNVLRHWGWLTTTYGDKYYHAGRFARKAAESFKRESDPGLAYLIGEKMQEEEGKGLIRKNEYAHNFNRIFDEEQGGGSARKETFLRLLDDGWGESVTSLIDAVEELS